MKCEKVTHLHATNQVMKCTTRTPISFDNLPLMSSTRGRRNSSSCHQPGDEMYNPYFNIIWQLSIHATNQVMKCTTRTLISFGNLPLMPPTR
ncbi:hypothetical protein FF2_006753 [Malus domestica]